jgi:hypothetical protein
MSKQFLKRVLNEEIARVAIKSSQARKITDLRVHKFYVTTAGLYNEMLTQLQLGPAVDRSYALERTINSQELQRILKEGAEYISSSVYDKAKQLSAQGKNIQIKGHKKRFYVLVKEGGVKQTSRGFYLPTTVFEEIKGYYREPVGKVVREINLFLSKRQDTELVDQSKFLDLGHKGTSAVAMRVVSESKTRIASRLQKNLGDKITEKDLEALGLEIFLSMDSTKQKSVMRVGLEATGANQKEGREFLKTYKSEYEMLLKNALAKIDVVNIEGSDSRLQIEKKKIVKAFDKSVKSKRVKKQSIDTKLNLSKSKATKSVKVKPKKAKSTAVPMGKVNIKTPKAKKSTKQSTITLAALINQKLPETVAKNMKAPGLRYRTGRFASSARVTDVVETAKGFPSIGYTYMKYPYQTFEPGFAQGSADRDPRKVIDKSIREIAMDLLVGRFYTRRV